MAEKGGDFEVELVGPVGVAVVVESGTGVSFEKDRKSH